MSWNKGEKYPKSLGSGHTYSIRSNIISCSLKNPLTRETETKKNEYWFWNSLYLLNWGGAELSIVLQNLCWNTYSCRWPSKEIVQDWTFLEVTNTPHIYCVVVGVIVIERMGWILLHIKPFFAASSSQTFWQGDTRMAIVHKYWLNNQD